MAKDDNEVTVVASRMNNSSAYNYNATGEELRPQLYLSPGQGRALGDLPGRLARLYRLDVYGISRMTERTSKEIGFMALAITVVTLIELGLWTLLWNATFYAGLIQIGWFTPLALFFALLFTMMIFIYERQFMVADTSVGSGRIKLAIALRVSVIILAALATTQPLEVLIFRGPVQERAHEESTRAYALDQLRAFEEKKQKTTVGGVRDTVPGTRWTEAGARLETARTAASQARGDKAAREKEKTTADGALTNAQKRLSRATTPKQIAARQREVDAARQKANTAAENFRQAEGKLTTAEAEEKKAEEDVTETGQAVTEELKGNEAEVEKLRHFIGRIRNAQPGEKVSEGNFTYQDRDYNFFERLSVINDLYHARSPRWPNASEEDKKKLYEKFGLSDSAQNDRLKDSAATFKWTYWAFFALPIVISLLLLALKFILPVEVAEYYSKERQAEVGNYDVLVTVGGKFASQPSTPGQQKTT